MSKMATIILKVQNVTKVVFFILFFCNNLYSQTNINGTFCIDYDLKDFSVCFKFEKNKSFKYEYSGDLGLAEFGKGEYSFIDNKLILNYNKTEPVKVGYHISKIWTNNRDTINIRFNLYDFDNNPISYANIVFKDSLYKQGYKMLALDNKEGKASITLKKDLSELEFQISSMEYGIPSSLYHSIYKLRINKNYNHDISVFLPKAESGLPILNQIDTLIIDKKKPKYFTVKNKDESITTWKKLDD